MYAINLALFVVMTENAVYLLRNLHDKQSLAMLAGWQQSWRPSTASARRGRRRDRSAGPDQSRADARVDSIGIVTVHDGPSLPPGEIIAPPVGTDSAEPNYHNNYQDPEAFLAAGGRRGRQYVPLTDGTYFINRWFATIEMIPKTVVPIGYVGVVVSYYGRLGRDLSGTAFRHGERVAEGERGVWEQALGPGKYAFNTYAGNIILVPTTNFVLHWITGRTRGASLRRKSAVDRPGDQGRLRAAAAAVGGRAHRLPEGAERDSAVRRREEADHADARSDAQRLLPRRGPQEDDARAAARARRDPGRSARRSCGSGSASSTSSASTC